MVEYTQWMRIALDDQRNRHHLVLDSLNTTRADAPLDQIAAIDSEARLRNGQLDTLFTDESELLASSQALGIDVADGWRSLEQEAVARADGLTGRLQLAQLDKEAFRQELADAERAGLSESEVARIRSEARALDRLIEDLSANLGATSDFLDTRGYSTSAYRQLVIQATGEVTGDILDVDVLVGLLSDGLGSAVSWFRTNGPTAVVRLLIVLVSILLGRWGVRLVWWLFRALRLVQLPLLAKELIGRALGPVGTVLGLGFGLWAIGADATTMLAGAGVAGVVVGFALQDSLANFASGFMILLYRPFDQDDTIEAAGIVGTVRSMGLANTTLITFDNRRVSIPNSKLWGAVIANRSSEPTRRAEAVVRVGFDQDLSEVSRIILDRLRAHEMVLDEPAPSAYVSGAGDSWMEVTVWAWTRNPDWWTVTAAMPALLKAALEEQGIPVPLPVQQLVGPVAEAAHPA
jgi:small conductance mechanosensitive channel